MEFKHEQKWLMLCPVIINYCVDLFASRGHPSARDFSLSAKKKTDSVIIN